MNAPEANEVPGRQLVGGLREQLASHVATRAGFTQC